jgi:hypothetical protein
MKTTGRSVATLGLVAASLVAALLLGEIGVRLCGLQGRAKVRVVPGRGITFEPGTAYRHVKEGFSEGRFNSAGFRDKERSIAKPAGGFRILVLGDSFVEAFQVALDESFPALLEERLRRRRGGAATEVLAMGQSGFGTASELMRYLDFGAAYAPDVVLLAFYAGNDVRDNSRLLSGDAPDFHFTLDATGSLRLDRSGIEALERARAASGWVEWLRDRSDLAALVSERLYLFRKARLAGRPAPSDASVAPGGIPDDRDDANVYREEAGPPWHDAWDVTLALLARLADETAARGSRLAIVSIGTAEQVEEDLGQTVLAAGPGRDLDLPDRRLEAMARKHGLPCLLLAPGLRAAEAAGAGRLYGFDARRGGHWNAAGHRTAALLIERFLEEQGLLAPVEEQGLLPVAPSSAARQVALQLQEPLLHEMPRNERQQERAAEADDPVEDLRRNLSPARLRLLRQGESPLEPEQHRDVEDVDPVAVLSEAPKDAQAEEPHGPAALRRRDQGREQRSEEQGEGREADHAHQRAPSREAAFEHDDGPERECGGGQDETRRFAADGRGRRFPEHHRDEGARHQPVDTILGPEVEERGRHAERERRGSQHELGAEEADQELGQPPGWRQTHDERPRQVELLFDRERPRDSQKRRRARARHRDEEVLPVEPVEGLQTACGRLSQAGRDDRRHPETEGEKRIVEGEDAQDPARVKTEEVIRRLAGFEELARDEIAGQHEEQIDAAPAETCDTGEDAAEEGLPADQREMDEQDQEDGHAANAIEHRDMSFGVLGTAPRVDARGGAGGRSAGFCGDGVQRRGILGPARPVPSTRPATSVAGVFARE